MIADSIIHALHNTLGEGNFPMHEPRFAGSEALADQRDRILQATNDAGLMTRPAWRLMHQLAPYNKCPPAPLPVPESLAQRLINLPSSTGLA